jgi:uncharacterized protein YcaQ
VILSLSESDAARFLVSYQLARSDIAGVFERLGSVQYDPLNPVGRNVDLVLQARVPGYRVDDWLQAAYRRRVAYDAWDKQACLVPVSDWPWRRPIRDRFHPWHDREILAEYPDTVETVFHSIDERGPLSSLEFEDRRAAPERHSWYGPTVVKRVLRALWATGALVTHHRVAGRHYYDRPERVIPEPYRTLPGIDDLDTYFRWIVLRRHQTAGLLRPGASAEIWSVCGDRRTRERAIWDLTERGDLLPVEVGTRRHRYYLPASAVDYVAAPPPTRSIVFVGPLDSLVWDRRAVRDIFGFDYIWEVYKKQQDRRWGYYVLPVLYGDRFVARIDSRLENGIWKIARWWWEEDARVTTALLASLRTSAARFVRYLGATSVQISNLVDGRTRSALGVA